MSEFNKYSTDGGATFIDVEDSTARTGVNNAFKVMGEMGAKNLLSLNATNVNSRDLTETKNYDDKGNIVSIKLDGSTGTSFNFYAMSARAKADAIRLKANTRYIVSIGNSNPNVRISVGYTNPVGGAYVDFGHSENGASEFEFVSPVDNAPWTIQFEAPNNTTLSNFIIYPMVRLASDTDNTYVPYAMTNEELTRRMLGIYSKPITIPRNSSVRITASQEYQQFFGIAQRNLAFLFWNFTNAATLSPVANVSSVDMPTVSFVSNKVTDLNNSITNASIIITIMSYADFTVS